MKTKTILCGLALSLAPTLSLAAGCSGMARPAETAMSCADGQVLDAETNRCVDRITS